MLIAKAHVLVEKPEYQSRNDRVLQAAHHAEPVIALDVTSLLNGIFEFLHGDLQLERRENAKPVGTGVRPVGLMMNDGPERGMFRWDVVGLTGSAATKDVSGFVVPKLSIADVGTTVFFDFLKHPIGYRKAELCELGFEVADRWRKAAECDQIAVG